MDHYSALRAQVAELTALHGTPVAVNYQSGGNVAYATWITGGRLLGYDLSSVHGATLQWDEPVTLLAGTTDVRAWAQVADFLAIDGSAELMTYWDGEDTYGYGEYSMGTYYVHNTGTGLTAIYGVGDEALTPCAHEAAPGDVCRYCGQAAE